MSYIYSKKDEKFKYSLSFQPIYDNNPNNLNQVPLPFKTQFDIFYNFLKRDNDKDASYTNSLFFDTIEYLANNKDMGLDQKTLLSLFLEINRINPRDKEIDKKIIYENFFKKINFVKLFEHCLINKKNINKEIIEDELKILKNIRNELVTITGNKEDINENIDIFIMFYLIYIKPEYFFEVLFKTEEKNYDNIKKHLLANKKLFKNFNSDILSSEFFSDAPTLDSIILIIKGFVPNMLEVLKLFSFEFFYLKFGTMLQMQTKYLIINILDLCEPRKTDETEEFFGCYEKIFDNFRNEGFLPIKLDENFFLRYCELFNNEDYKKIESIYRIVEFHNKNVRKNSRIKIEDKIIEYYHNTGIHLIEKKQLFNEQMFEFLNNDEFLIQNEKEEKENKLKSMLNTITLGIHFDKKETKFINDLLSNKMIGDDFNIKSFFGNLYGIFIKSIFKKLTTPEELLNLGDCEIRFDAPDEILENFILLIERIWIAHPIKFPENILDLIAQALSYASIKIPEIHLKVYQSLENNISKDILMSLYCLILIKQYDLSEEYRAHIVYYIKMNCGDNALSVWYLLNTIDINDEYERVEFLRKNLKDEFIVKVEDFIGFLNKKNEKIILFQNLKMRKCFNLLDGALTETSYYKNSLESKSNIFSLKFKDAIYVYKNIYQFRDLFIYFTPIEESKEQQELNVEILLITFSDTIGPMKSFFDSLEKISNFLEQFFPNDKKEDINEIKKVIINLENSSLNEFKNIQNKNLIYKDKYLKDAEEGEILKDSLFFMEIYNYSKLNKNNNEQDIYNNAIKSFSNLKNLGIDNNLNSLDIELQDIIISSIHNNRERLNNELNFIKNYFFKNKNENDNKYNNFNISKLKREILKSVKNAEKEIGNLDDNLLEKVEIYDDDNVNNEALKTFDSKKLIMEEKKRLIEKFYKLGHDYLVLAKKINYMNGRPDECNSLTDSFKNFFNELFKVNFGFAKLENESEFNESIIALCKKIYMNKVEFNFQNESSIILIYEFFDILETYEQNGKTSKKIMFLLLQKMNELNKIKNKNEIVNCLNDLFSSILENVKEEEDLTVLLIKLLIKEVKKNKEDDNFYRELLKNLIFLGNTSNYPYQFLFHDLSPVIDEIFGNEFTNCLELNRNIQRDNILVRFEKPNYPSSFQVIKDNIKNINIKEMLLFYLETKIMNILDSSFNENEDFTQNNVKYLYLDKFLEYLERNKNSNRDELLKLFAIAYIKCYYSKIINFLCNNYKEIGDSFFELLSEGNTNEFKISMMIYVLKLVYGNIDNIYELEISGGFVQKIFNKIIQKIKDNKYWDFDKVLRNKNSGFDFLIYPNEDNELFLKGLNTILEAKKNDQNNYDENFIKNLNELNSIDLLYCVLLNTVFSLFYQNYSHEDNKKIIKWLNEILNKNEIQILKSNQMLTKIFQFLINEKSYEEKIAFSINIQKISYQQLLSILISFRYVLKIIQLNNKEGLFNNFINNSPKDIFEKNKKFFNRYLNENSKDQRDINYLTYKIIKYVIYSFLCVNYLLEKISLEEVYKIIGYNPKADEGNCLLLDLFKEFDFIRNDLLKTLGIRNIIIYMNIIFDDVINIINTIKINTTEKEIKEMEDKLEKKILEKTQNEKLAISIREYFNKIDKFNEGNQIDNNSNPKKFYNILIEDESYYNSKDEKNKLPFIYYLTYTNFACYDDFKKQYLYFKNDPKSYPMIDCVLKENKILKIVEFIPVLNEFINQIYNKLILDITKEDANQKIIDKKSDTKFNDFNVGLNNFLCVYDGDVTNIEINVDSKISDVINLEGNKINKIYSWIINEYNKFLETMYIYDENERYIKEVIIQNSTENDYISFKSNGKSIQERLKEIICLYSKRNRINEKQELNVYNGGKIEYNFNLIENMLEKEFFLCKRKFSKMQKLFIFSNEIFGKQRAKMLEEFIKKYNQVEIVDKDTINNIETYLNKNTNDIKVIYYNCLHLILYLMIYLKDEKLNLQKLDINNYLIKLMEKENNQIDKKFKNLFENLKLNINQIYALYEIIEEKAFHNLLEKIKDETTEYETEKENELFKKIIENNTILKEDILIKGIKKYIIRYCLGDYNGKKPILKDVKFEDMFNKIDIWGETIFNNEKFKEESKTLISEYHKDNNLLIYCYEIVFKKTINQEEEKDIVEEEPEEDEF